MRGIPAGAIAGCERAQPDARRPALAALEQVGGLLVRERGIRPAQERVALARAQRQIGGPQLEQLPARAKPCDRQAGREAAHERQRGSRRNVGGQGRDRLGRVAGAEQVSVVDDEDDVPGRAQPCCEPRQFRRPVLRPAKAGAVRWPVGCRRVPRRAARAGRPRRRRSRRPRSTRTDGGRARPTALRASSCRSRPVPSRSRAAPPPHAAGSRAASSTPPTAAGRAREPLLRRRSTARLAFARSSSAASIQYESSADAVPERAHHSCRVGWHEAAKWRVEPARAARRRAAGPSMHADRSAASRGR